jgi:hypothetical protein
MMLISITASVAAIPIVWVVTSDAAARTAAIIVALVMDSVIIWLCRPDLRELRALDEAEQRTT